MRGIAALCVLVHHLAVFYDFPEFKAGYLAVDFFFVLSGYVMARTYEGRFPTAPRFLWMRFKRFWPTVMIGSALGLLVLVWKGELGPVAVALAVLILPNPWTLWAFPLNPPAWSLFLELTANFIHGFVARVSTPVLAICVVALAGFNLLVASRTNGMIAGPEFSTLLPGVLRVCLGYFLGIVLYRTWQDQPPLRLPALATALFLPLLLALGQSWWFDILFVLVACPLLIMGGLAWNPSWGHRVGAVSFPLYAVHYPILEGFSLTGIAWPLAALAALALATAMSARWAGIGRWWPRRPTA